MGARQIFELDEGVVERLAVVPALEHELRFSSMGEGADGVQRMWMGEGHSSAGGKRVSSGSHSSTWATVSFHEMLSTGKDSSIRATSTETNARTSDDGPRSTSMRLLLHR